MRNAFYESQARELVRRCPVGAPPVDIPLDILMRMSSNGRSRGEASNTHLFLVEEAVSLPGSSRMRRDTKRIVLAHLPYTSPLGPPLGVCMLKSHVDRMALGWSARVMDLNLLYHEEVLATLDENDPPVLEGNRIDPATLRRAVECFRGGNDEEFYGQPERYDTYVYSAYRFFPPFTRAFYKRLEAAYRNAEVAPNIIEKFTDRVMAEDPDAVGLSVCYNEQFWFGICLAKLIKQRSEVPIIFGGTFFLQDPEDILLGFEDVIDFIITGEGEQALTQFLTHPDAPEDVPGLCWRSEGEPRTNSQAYERKLDVLGHPDFSDLDFGAYHTPSPVIPILTSRGCYWRRCAFCTHYQSYGLTYRMHSIHYVIEEMKRHIADGISDFSLVDELLSAKRFDQLAVAIIEAKLDVRYYAMSRPTRDFSRDRLQRMYDSGCRFMMWGLESANQRILDRIEKGTNKSDVRDLLHDSAAVGLFNHVFIFFGFPTETQEEAAETVRFLDENREVIHTVQQGTFLLVKGSPIFDHPENYSISNLRRIGGYPDHNYFTYKSSEGMTAKQASRFLDKAIPYLRSFNPYARGLGKCREHALLIYSRMGEKLDLESRNFPPCPVPGQRKEVSRAEGVVEQDVPGISRGSEPSVAKRRRRRWLLRIATAIGARMSGVLRYKVKANLRRYPNYAIEEHPGFLSDLECNHLIEAARGRIGGANRHREEQKLWIRLVPRGNKTFLQRDEQIRRIQKKIGELTGTAIGRQESILVTHYDEFDYAASHFDNVGHGNEAGDREYTVMVYLNDDFDGGGTDFPEAGKRIVPEKGKAVVFRNLTEERKEQHPLARHVEVAVLSGEKWVCTQWVRQRPLSNAPVNTAVRGASRGRQRANRPRARAKKRRGRKGRK